MGSTMEQKSIAYGNDWVRVPSNIVMYSAFISSNPNTTSRAS